MVTKICGIAYDNHKVFGTSNASFSAVSLFFLACNNSFFSIFYDLSGENGPETAKTLKRAQNLIFRDISSEFCKILRKNRVNLFFPDFFL